MNAEMFARRINLNLGLKIEALRENLARIIHTLSPTAYVGMEIRGTRLYEVSDIYLSGEHACRAEYLDHIGDFFLFRSSLEDCDELRRALANLIEHPLSVVVASGTEKDYNHLIGLLCSTRSRSEYQNLIVELMRIGVQGAFGHHRLQILNVERNLGYEGEWERIEKNLIAANALAE